jgi:carboxyl-terminal processing protease
MLMSQSARRWSLVAAIPLLVGCVLGGLLGGRVQAEAQHAEDGLWTFGRVLAVVEDEYIGEIDSEELVMAAIDGLLSGLDPHSNYLDSDSFAEMRDEQRGKFHGLGIQITKRGPDKPLTIIAPIDGTPAWRAGLQSGDIISEIEGEPTIDLTVQQSVRRLKGDKGTKVMITIERPGMDEPFQVTIERDEIPIQSVRVAYMLRPDVGVVRIGNFNTTTAEELDAAIEKLRGEGMERLILDLRSNPGGLLEQAVEVTERFIDPGKLIVYTQGRIPGSNQRFVARQSGDAVDMPLVVLVDGSSASASEIVSGAIQDHDRGLVVGETTFGKGLVQRVIPIQAGEGGALAVTTAKYHTPSGRLIQRDYSDLDDYYLANREEESEETEPIEVPTVAEVEEPSKEIFHTASGREVYGGGGITPDYVVKTPRPSDLWFELNRENLIFDYAVLYVARHAELATGFQIDDATLQDFQRFLNEKDFEYSVGDFEQARDELALRLRAHIARIKWDQAEESRIRAEGDPQIQKALEVFDEAAALRRRAQLIEATGGNDDLRAGAATSPL